MIDPQKHSLKSFVQRVLVFRLTVAGLVISFIIGLSVFLVERNKVSEEVVDFTLQATSFFNYQNLHLFDAPGLPDHEVILRALQDFISGYAGLKTGHFVLLRLYRTDLTMITEIIDEDYSSIKKIKTLADTSENHVPRNKDDLYDIIKVDGIPHIKVLTPLFNTTGDVVAFISGVFAISTKTIGDIRGRAVRTMLITIVVVLLTTLLLFPIIINLAHKLVAFSTRLLDSNLETLETLGSAIAQRDSDTNTHNYRVTIYSVRIAEAAGLSNRIIQTLIKGAFLHDVGKIGISDSILLKPGRLTEDEFDVMKTHVSSGHEIVKRSLWLRDALEVVGYHHEKVNGQGYPEGLEGKEIPISARIFAIADVFDALTSRRPYKEAFSFEKAMSILEESRGSHFDPEMLDAFTGIAKPLYDHLANRDDEPREELESIIRQYFTESIDSLDY